MLYVYCIECTKSGKHLEKLIKKQGNHLVQTNYTPKNFMQIIIIIITD